MEIPKSRGSSLPPYALYPIFSYIFAAILGAPFQSALIGMQLAAFIALFTIWSSFAYCLSALPKRVMILASVAIISLMLVNGYHDYLEIHGHELIQNYFFAQLVGQAAMLLFIPLVLGSAHPTQTIRFDLPSTLCQVNKSYKLFINIDKAVSPAELKLSSDTRKLGLNLRSLRYVG